MAELPREHDPTSWADGRAAARAGRTAPTRRWFLQSLGATALGLAGCSKPAPTNLSLERTAIPYGPDPSQSADLLLPLTAQTLPVVVAIHGGYWRVGFDRTSLNNLADGLARAGYAVWNIDYRRVGEAGGGWPGTFDDVAAAIDKLVDLAPARRLDLGRAAVLGHSAGGELALWAAARHLLPAGAVGSDPKVRFRAAVSLAGVVDLAESALADQGTGQAELRAAILALMDGGPDRSADRYAQLSPLARLPIGVPQLIVHGGKDDRVSVDQSRRYAQTATAAGDAARLVELPAADHFEVIRTDRAGWDDLLTWLTEHVPVRR